MDIERAFLNAFGATKPVRTIPKKTREPAILSIEKTRLRASTGRDNSGRNMNDFGVFVPIVCTCLTETDVGVVGWLLILWRQVPKI